MTLSDDEITKLKTLINGMFDELDKNELAGIGLLADKANEIEQAAISAAYQRIARDSLRDAVDQFIANREYEQLTTEE